ncbi:hypothetical protein LEP1GSC061_0418 [Leptospira wolffii serovar Khorat str. Khorat-H2]|nr:hypothetical protein LEP1GSC061_0418 [Leptospira wolffii serovar Khorat str. Khorat-H2]
MGSSLDVIVSDFGKNRRREIRDPNSFRRISLNLDGKTKNSRSIFYSDANFR